MSESEDSEAGSDGNSKTGTNTTVGRQERPNKVTLKACDLKVEAQSNEMEADELAEVLSPEMEKLMEYHLRGEYEVLEEQEFFSVLLGGD